MNWLLAVVLLFNGILAGLSLDKVIVQLPARAAMGVIDYARYARAADLRNGVVFYAVTGVGAAVLTVVAALVAFAAGTSTATRALLGLAAVLSVLHTAATAVAAPTMLRVGRSPDTESTLAPLLTRFARVSAVRAALQVTTFAVLAVAAIG